MNDDFDRRLSEALNAERTQSEARAEADLPRIKGTVMDNIHSRKRFTMMAAVGAAAVALVAGAISVPRLLGDTGPDPAPPAGESPSPEPTLDESVTVDETEVSSGDCSDLPFQPTYLPEGFTYELRPGDGGQVGVPLGKQNPQAYGHWRGGEDSGFINIYKQDAYYQLSPDAETMKIFVQPGRESTARFGAVEDGYAIEFGANGCNYSAIGFGISEDEMRTFADGLIQTTGNEVDDVGFAIYPDVSPRQAGLKCFTAADWQRSPDALVDQFAKERLGIDEPEVGEPTQDQEQTIAVGDERWDVANVTVREIGHGCWYVVAVWPSHDSGPQIEEFSFGSDGVEVHLVGVTPQVWDLYSIVLFDGDDLKGEVLQQPEDGKTTYEIPFGKHPPTHGAFLSVFRTEEGAPLGAFGLPIAPSNGLD